MKTLWKALLIGAVCTVSGVGMAATASDPALGSWALNVAKSTFPAGEAPKSETRTYSKSADGITMKITGVAADGSTMSMESTYKYDGKDYPISGSKGFDTLSVKKVNGTTIHAGLKLGDKPVGKAVRTVSGHGKVLTLTTDMGKTIHMVGVYDKQ